MRRCSIVNGRRRGAGRVREAVGNQHEEWMRRSSWRISLKVGWVAAGSRVGAASTPPPARGNWIQAAGELVTNWTACSMAFSCPSAGNGIEGMRRSRSAWST